MEEQNVIEQDLDWISSKKFERWVIIEGARGSDEQEIVH